MRSGVLAVCAVLILSSSQAAAAPSPTVPPAVVRTSLASLGWSDAAASWVLAHHRVEYETAPGVMGGFAPGMSADSGRITISRGLPPRDEALALDEEAHHAWDHGHHELPRGLDEAGVAADLLRLAAVTDPRFLPAAQSAAAISWSRDVAHHNHRLAEAINFDFTRVPRWYAERRFAYAARMADESPEPVQVVLPVRYRTLLPTARTTASPRRSKGSAARSSS